MRRTALALVMFSLIAASGLATPAEAQTPTPAPPVVVASGEHRIKVAPDQAWATVSLQTRDAKAPEARRLAAAAMTTVTTALRQSGLAADAIQTIGFSLQPEYEYVNQRQRMKGFLVTNQVQVRIDDVSKVADVLDAVGSLSLPTSSVVTIAGLRFDLKNRASVERDALKGAVEDAMARAKSMAAGAGLTLGRTLRIEESGGQVMQKFDAPMMMARASRGGAEAQIETPIEPADIEIRAQVNLTIEIK
ncbi:MAG TPA: SIMPL domain-containing protein [Vicinamibacterales bacterium]|nr:SIMPL domain-containing protein [Vicinamibacterales bacterium]